MDKTPMANEPVTTLRDGKLKAVLWQNSNREGQIYHSVTLAKTYEDRDGKLQDTNSFSESELLRISKLAEEMRGVMLEMRRDRAHEKALDKSRDAAPRDERPERFKGR